MATIKSYTDLEQSRKLAEILPLESADMFYRNNGIDVKLMWEHNAQKVTDPCWSLAALFNVLPHIQEFYPTFEKINDKYVCRYKDSGIWTNGTNSVDACYEMIIKLNERKML